MTTTRTGIRRRAGMVAAVLAATALVVAAAGTGHADEAPTPAGQKSAQKSLASPSRQIPDTVPAGFASWLEVFAMQDKLNAAARRIVAARGAGYAGIVAAPQNRALHVYWKGTVPGSLRQLVGQLGVPVTFKAAAYTEREMLAETHRLAADPEVLAVGPEADGSGLAVDTTAAGRQAIVSRTGKLGAATMPLHLSSEAAPSHFNRQNDISPHWGGAKFTAGRFECTSGFGVRWAGFEKWLTAGHCGNNGDQVRDGGGDLIGDVFNDSPARDTMMVHSRFLEVTFEGSIYGGPPDSNWGLTVTGATEDFHGNLVCVGGHRTGEHCNLNVTHVDQVVLGAFPMNRAQLSSGCAAAWGDSGAPVYSYSGAGQVVGRGTFSAGIDNTADCAPHAPPSESSRFIAYAPLLRPVGGPTDGSLQFYGATILTK